MSDKTNSVDRLISIIEKIGESKSPLPASDIIFDTGIPKPTCHRLLQQLEEANYIQPDERGHFYPGSQMLSIALDVKWTNQHKLQRQAILHGLANKLEETCGLALANDDPAPHMVYYDRIQTNWPLQIVIPVGFPTPLWASASGKLYLSTLTPPQLRRVLSKIELTQCAKNTITDKQSLKKELSQIQRRGYSVDNEEFIDGMVAISLPLYDHDGNFMAALFCHCPKSRKDVADLESFLPILRSAQRSLETVYQDMKQQFG
ncbi:IclR family transcriptional regulator [Vibrio europaeus]|uniref:HTH-type transcriptional repressor AllR n=1 Tax=Vibrio europaeus TaxID=300876 RepID=A0A178JD98_9VIBR|nr:IclR family transcriptional regulator [Vibrio europaeus]MDC5707600.1 IclR family transcriptional regulator [Vibrio europaeus]MDC5709846.1 IclR family transcriptional regulator [Vibrio europaeus]MDC5716677.1 IclR family transcriptional regulator [Vibrio europaeus]MDC5722702.1 IclR family transcriptional regulator [Vibrio europaeus]MDC5726997.1 IclR family transcriptional regulator [Vibrio europaeus]